MINSALNEFINNALETKLVTKEDVDKIRKSLSQVGISNRAEADALIALDRVISSDKEWSNFLVAEIVKFVLWGGRRKGHINAETAHWLISSLEVGELTDTAILIVREAVSQAVVVDPVLVDFVLQRIRRYSRTQYNGQAAA